MYKSAKSNTTLRILKMILSSVIQWNDTARGIQRDFSCIPSLWRGETLGAKLAFPCKTYKNCGYKVWIGVSACHSHPWSFADLQNHACFTRSKAESYIFGSFLKSISLNSTYPPVHEWINKTWSSHTVGWYSTLKMNEIWIQAIA